MINSGIYIISNILDGKAYVGSAINFKKRKKLHFWELGNNRHYNRHLQGAWNKYGRQNFEFTEVELVKPIKKLLLKSEQYWIDLMCSYKDENGYNICPTAGSNQGTKFTEEHKEKLRQSNIGKKRSEETKAKMRKPRSEIAKKNMSKGQKGKPIWNKGISTGPLSEETKLKMSEASKGKPKSEEHKRNISKNHARHWLGKSMSKETREKISKSNMGRSTWNKGIETGLLSKETKLKMSIAKTGKNNPMSGKKHTEEAKKKMNEARL